jgi:hypothetical protein
MTSEGEGPTKDSSSHAEESPFGSGGNWLKWLRCLKILPKVPSAESNLGKDRLPGCGLNDVWAWPLVHLLLQYYCVFS